MKVSDARRLKSFEEKNAKLKRVLADTMLEVVVLEDLLGKRCLEREPSTPSVAFAA